MPSPPSENQPWSEYRLLVIQTMSDLSSEVKRLHDDNIIMKARMGLIAPVFGAVGGIAGAVMTAIVLHWLKLK